MAGANRCKSHIACFAPRRQWSVACDPKQAITVLRRMTQARFSTADRVATFTNIAE
ncbi:hypothetical protein PSP6_280003 [Paraburkholderia tropica]|nr:hypothetical protein PSP6_280003 [Paraburkholderia tropica]